jgi:hypothetical protein
MRSSASVECLTSLTLHADRITQSANRFWRTLSLALAVGFYRDLTIAKSLKLT